MLVYAIGRLVEFGSIDRVGFRPVEAEHSEVVLVTAVGQECAVADHDSWFFVAEHLLELLVSQGWSRRLCRGGFLLALAIQGSLRISKGERRLPG